MGKRKSCKLRLVEIEQTAKSSKGCTECTHPDEIQTSELGSGDLQLSSNPKEWEDTMNLRPDSRENTESPPPIIASKSNLTLNSPQVFDHTSNGNSMENSLRLELEVPGNEIRPESQGKSEIPSPSAFPNPILSELNPLPSERSIKVETDPTNEKNENLTTQIDSDIFASIKDSSNIAVDAAEAACARDLCDSLDNSTDEKWDVIRKLDPKERITCRVAGCRRRAVECWVSTTAPDDEWNMCRKCIDLDFGLEGSEKVSETLDDTKKGFNGPVLEPLPQYNELTSSLNRDVLLEDNALSFSAAQYQSTKSQIVSPEQDMEEITIEVHANRTANISVQDSSSTSQQPGFRVQKKVLMLEDVNKGSDQNVIERKLENFSKWDFVKELDPQSEATCGMTGCCRKAVECWASNFDPKIERNICKPCIQSNFAPKEVDHIPDVIPCEKVSIVGNEEYEISQRDLVTSEDEEKWDIQRIISFEELMREGTIKCSSESCILAAAALYCSTSLREKWYSCLDCQLADFGGWPEKLEDIPIMYMTDEHKKVMGKKCSRLSSPRFPKFPVHEKDLATSSLKMVKDISCKQGQPSAEALEIHRRWQAAAEAMGGSDVRIIVEKKIAKKKIYDLLYDSFRPMNITQIFSALKAVVPSPVLKQCLDEMVLDNEDTDAIFVDSDDDDIKPEKKKKCAIPKEEFSQSLILRSGKNSSTSLYYIDHSKQKNEGNGLDSDVREKLLSEKSLADQSVHSLTDNHLQTEDHTKLLLSEPTNEELEIKLEALEIVVSDLQLMVQEARKFKVNENTKKKIKTRIHGMTLQWRKRRRICMEFLTNLEENTDGSINLRKCLTGDGQIDIESDEKAISDSRAYAESRRTRKPLQCKQKVIGSVKISEHSDSNANLIGVLLDSQGNVTRVYI